MKHPSLLTESELTLELAARRAVRRGVAPTRHSPPDRLTLQAFANLELSVSATTVDIERKYLELLNKYAPERFASDSEQQKLAAQLRSELQRAYGVAMGYAGAKP